jgi:hypothetical protein
MNEAAKVSAGAGTNPNANESTCMAPFREHGNLVYSRKIELLTEMNKKLENENVVLKNAFETISDIQSSFRDYPNRTLSYRDYELREIARQALDKVIK